jgi:hypothetical protein
VPALKLTLEDGQGAPMQRLRFLELPLRGCIFGAFSVIRAQQPFANGEATARERLPFGTPAAGVFHSCQIVIDSRDFAGSLGGVRLGRGFEQRQRSPVSLVPFLERPAALAGQS